LGVQANEKQCIFAAQTKKYFIEHKHLRMLILKTVTRATLEFGQRCFLRTSGETFAMEAMFL